MDNRFWALQQSGFPEGNSVHGAATMGQQGLKASRPYPVQTILAEAKKVTTGLAGLVETPRWVDWFSVVVIVLSAIFVLMEFSCLARERKKKSDEGGATASSLEAPLKQDETASAPAAEAEVNPRRWYILFMAAISVFGCDIYLGMPNTFFPAEVGKRDGANVLSATYFAMFPLGGMLSAWLGSKLLEFYPPNRLNRVALTLSILSATVQGLCHLAKDLGGFIGSLAVLRFLEGLPSMVTEICAMTMVQRSFQTTELPAAMGAFIGIRQIANLIGPPIGGALYAGGGFGLPYAIGGLFLCMVYALVYFTLAKEASLEVTPKNHDLLGILKHWRFTAVLASYSADFILVQILLTNLQIWVGAPPYSLKPVMVSVLSISITLSFVVGMILFQVVSAKATIYWTGNVFNVAQFIVSLFVGYQPVGSRNFPATFGAAIGICIAYAATFGMLATKQALGTHVLKDFYGLPRESTDAPVGTVFVFVALLGSFLGPMVFGPIVDAVGFPITVLITSAVALVINGIMAVAMWPYRGLKAIGDESDDTGEEKENEAELAKEATVGAKSD